MERERRYSQILYCIGKKLWLIALGGILLLPVAASAHEAYVLPKDFFSREIAAPADLQAFAALRNPHDLAVTLEITIGIIVALLLNFLFRLTAVGNRFHSFFEKFARLGPVFVRVAIAAAFFMGARSGAFLGPELPLAQLPFAEVLRWLLYAASAMILGGIFTELAAFVGLVIFTLGFFAFGGYLMTYLNYLGELIALFLFGMREWSLDRRWWGPLKGWRQTLQSYETTIVRIFYGAALIYAGVNVKLLHAPLTLKVINDWGLTRFHWLFPSDPLLVVLGAGLAEVAIGLFILLGFELRMTVFVSLFYITLSLFFFRELVWPHILLYGISLNLIVQPEVFTLDHLLFKEKRWRFWLRPFLPHRKNAHGT